MTERKYTIGELSEICDISKSALRLYDEKGLLKPSGRDDNNNYRLYSEKQIPDALMIREMKRRGFSMGEIKKLVKNHNQRTIHVAIQDLSENVQVLEQKLSDIQGQLEYLRAAKEVLSQAVKNYEEDLERSEKKMVVDFMPEMTILFDRQMGFISAHHILWDRCNDIWRLREKEQVTVDGPLSAIYHDHYFNQFFFDKGDLEMYLPIKETGRTGPNIRRFGGFYRASMVFVGKYIDLLDTYVELVKQIENSPYRIIGPAFEEYMVEFSYSIPEEQSITKVSFPVEKTAE